MKHHEHRGVSLGTIVMLALTVAVLTTCGAVLPKLMGSASIRIEDLAMRSSVNLSESVPSVAVIEIPIANATSVPAITPEPTAVLAQATATPVLTAATATAAPSPTVGGTVNLTFGGSIVLDDLIRKSGYYADSEKYDYTENLSMIADSLDSDLTLVTLEAVTDRNGNVRQLPNAPDVVMDMLKAANVDMVALGYNRSADLGVSGLAGTVAQARARGLETLGAYDSSEDAQRLRIFTFDQVRVAYLHYTNNVTSAGRKNLNAESAGYALPTAEIDGNNEKIVADIAFAKESGADIVIVSLNWSGSSSFSTTSAKMKTFMQSLADAGADVIVGSGTKAVRELSWLMGKRPDGTTRQTLCAWSLGSLLNGERKDGNVMGMLLHLQLSYNGSTLSFERVTYTPTYIWRFKQDGQYRYRVVQSDLPAPDGMDSTQADNALRSFENLKKTLGDSPVTLRIP